MLPTQTLSASLLVALLLPALVAAEETVHLVREDGALIVKGLASGDDTTIAERGRAGGVLVDDQQRVTAAAVLPGEDRERLWLAQGRRGVATLESLPEPAVDGPLLESPWLLARTDSPEWALWLDGDRPDRMAIRAARWLDGGWSVPETVSPIGPGTQIALRIAPTGDGEWLAVWAAYDGTDDELMWSRGDADGWSTPAPVEEDDRVPDILPSLLPSDGGVLAAWAEYDGRVYRTRLARWADGVWSEATSPGVEASSRHELLEVGGVPLLVERAVRGEAGWWVHELGSRTGLRVLRSAFVATASQERPRIDALDDRGLSVSGAGARATGRAEWVSSR